MRSTQVWASSGKIEEQASVRMFFTRRVEVVGFCLAWPHLVMTLPPRSARSAQPVSMLCRSDTDTGLLYSYSGLMSLGR